GSAPERELRYWLENNLTANDVRRVAVLPATLPRGLDELRRSYLVSDRTDDSGRGSLELSHDRFARTLVESNRDWFKRYTSPLWRDFADYRRSPRSHGRLIPFWTLYAGFRERRRLSLEESKFLYSAARPYLALAGLVVVAILGLSLAGYWRYREIQDSKRAEILATSARAKLVEYVQKKDVEDAAWKALVSGKETDAQLGTAALKASQQAWFSALTRRNDELALAQALTSVALAKRLAEPPGTEKPEQANGSDRVFAAAKSALIGRVASDRFSRRRLLGKGYE